METFKKRQKEMQRLEKQRDKAAKRMQKKQARANGEVAPEDDLGLPLDGPPAPEGQAEDAQPAVEPVTRA
jgi:hypothetical protein